MAVRTLHGMHFMTVLAVACALAHMHMCMAVPGRTLAQQLTSLGDQRFNYQIGEPFNMSQHALPGVQVYFIDLFHNSPSKVAAMKDAGLLPVCYFSAGVYESSAADAADFPDSVLGASVAGPGAAPGQRWLDVRSSIVRNNMAKRFKLCRDKGFVAADPGNTDAYLYANGYDLKQADLREYVLWLAAEAHRAGLQVGLLNSVALIDAGVAKEFDFAINTACFQLNECDKLAPFKDASKPIYHIEFSPSAAFAAEVCPKQEDHGLISVRKEKDLGAFPYVTCPTVAASRLTKAESMTASSIAASFVMLSISGGNLGFTPATSSDARLAGVAEPAAKPVFLNGSLTLVGTSGLGLLVGPGIFSVKRRIDWTYDMDSKTYTASTNVEGAVQLVKYAGSGNKNAERQRSLSCNIKGPLRLTSQTYPGPGGNGNYNWAGNFTISPNPWVYWSKDDSSAARRLLSGDGVPITIQVEGLIGASEDTGFYPSAAEDAARNDGSQHLDADGNVRVLNGKDVPPEAIPDWKTNPPRSGRGIGIPYWLLWLLVALGAVILIFMLLWALLLILRRRREAQAASEKKEAVVDPKLSALKAEAAVSSGRASGHVSPRHSAGGAADKV